MKISKQDKGDITMRKINKSLAVLLSVLMLASFLPIFASAEAIKITRTNVKIVPPTVSPTVIQYGENLSGLTLTGGECWYVNPDTGEETLVPGHFEIRSTTTKPAINEAYKITLKFVSDDTTQYSNISMLSGSTATIKSGTWPTIKVNGLDGTLVEAPTAAGILSGQTLSDATLSGGVVNDVDGNPLSGTWSYVYPSMCPEASGNYEVKFKATDYNVLYTTVYVDVTPGAKVTLAEPPVAKRVVSGNRLTAATLSGGKVLDENGTEITTGTWKWIDDDTQSTTEFLTTLGTFTFKAQWVAVGYENITADISVLIAADKGYTVEQPALASPVTYVVGLTFDMLPFVYGEASVPGTYSTNKDGTKVVANDNTTQSVTLKFTPDDPTLDVTSWSYSFKVAENDVWYTPSEETLKIVVPYGYSDNSVMYAYNTGNLGGALNWPDHFMEQRVYSFTWSKDNYDIASMEVGEMALVTGVVRYERVDTTVSLMYEAVPETVYIQIQPGVHKGDLCTLEINRPDTVTQEITMFFSTKIPGATGTFTITQGDEVLAVLTPDENGRIEREMIKYQPKEDGNYAFTATYTPGLMDKVIIENPVYTSQEVAIDIRGQVKVVSYNDELKVEREGMYICGSTPSCSFVISTGNGYRAEDIETWEFYDQNGNKIEVYNENGETPELKGRTSVTFVVPDEETGITEIHCYPIGPWSPDNSFNASSGESIFDKICSFFRMIIDWFTRIFNQIKELFAEIV